VALWRYVAGGDVRTLLSAPFVYSIVVPMAIVDVWVSAYQAFCFRLWRIPRVPRRPYLVFDRQHLPYLNGLERLNCVFCGYANGVIAFVREVAARTEQYWCPIHHRRAVPDPHSRYPFFVAYGDADAYRHDLPALRRAWSGTNRRHGVRPHARRSAS
jgi:hypothetical protein